MNSQLVRHLSYLEQDPENSQLLCDIAHMEYLEGKTEDAWAHAQRAIASAEALPLAYTILGLVASDHGRMEEAANHFAKAIGLGDSDPYILFRYAQALALTKRFTEAEGPARAAAADVVRAPDAELLLVRVLHYLGNVEEAIGVAQTAIEAGRGSARLYSMLSTLLVDNSDFEGAAKASAQALILNPDDPEALATQGLVSLNALNSQEALIDFQRAIASQPANGRAHLGEGLSYMLTGELGRAAESIDHATTHMPTHVGTYHALAWCHILNKDVDAAEKALNTAYELNHNFGETHGGLAIVAIMRGQLDKAKKYAQQATRLDKNSVSAQFAQVLIQEASGKPGRAKQMMETLLTQPILANGQTVKQAVAKYLAKQV